MTILTTSGITSIAPSVSTGSTQRVRIAEPAMATAPLTVPETVAVPAQVQAAASKLEQVQRAIDRLKQSIKPALANSLEFQIDQSTGKAVVMILDKETNTIVRQIPSEEVLSIAQALDRMQGRGGLVRQQA